jgi:hypothetical protein
MIAGSYYIGDDARDRALADALSKYSRIGICGAPLTGKAALAGRVTDRPVIDADRYLHPPFDVGFPEVPARIIAECAPLERYVVHGVQVARALRGSKTERLVVGLAIECLIWLVKPVAPQTPRQIAAGKGAATVLNGIRLQLTIPVLVVP